ncbi:MAG TPA: hypothetical protein PLD39_00065, partial [Flexilinea sp.]|nr:hypothetical protein [Flexilinea sp.]
MPEKENKQENEPQKPSGSRLNSESLIPDILALGCIVTGLLLWVGFTGKTDGRFILRMRNFF